MNIVSHPGVASTHSMKSKLYAVFALCRTLLVLGTAICGNARAADDPQPSDDPQDITGTWVGTGFYDPVNRSFRPMDGSPLPFTPAGQALYTMRREADKAGHPINHDNFKCAPGGFPGGPNGQPYQIIQTPGQVTFVGEVGHTISIVRLNKPHPKNPVPTFMGDSIGHWEGDTLVIDTIRFRGDKWLDFLGTPASDKLEIIGHIKKVKTDSGKVVLQNIITVVDPEMYTKPWNVRRISLWRPNERVNEEVCEEDGTQQDPQDPNAPASGKE